jgi:nitrite reductase/ring-hydroxylating ferredoxin subunit
MADQSPARSSTPPTDLAALGAWVDGLIRELAAHPDPTVGERAFALLDGVDALHRAALGRLVALLQAPDGAAVWTQAHRDPVIRAVLLLYDLVSPGGAGPEAGAPSTDFAALPVRPAITLPVRHEPVPLPGKRGLPVIAASSAPQWRDVATLDDLPPGTLHGCRVDGVAVLLCNADGDIAAYEDACPDTPLALSPGQIDGDDIVCPWHGCRFEARSGRRSGHRGTGLRAFPVVLEGTTIRVAVNVTGPRPVGGQLIAVTNRSRP